MAPGLDLALRRACGAMSTGRFVCAASAWRRYRGERCGWRPAALAADNQSVDQGDQLGGGYVGVFTVRSFVGGVDELHQRLPGRGALLARVMVRPLAGITCLASNARTMERGGGDHLAVGVGRGGDG